MEQKVQQRLQNNPALLQALYTWVTEAETCKQLHALECSCLDGTRNMAQAMMSEQLAAVAQDGPAAGTRHGKKKSQ
jgi:hypothetical protein